MRYFSAVMEMDHIINILYQARKWLFGLALFLSFMAVSFHFENGGIQMAWASLPLLAVGLLASGLFLLLLYIYSIQWRLNQLHTGIGQAKKQADLLADLTPRQREVYDLIMAGKTNKEIMAELFVELSTLKTHINHIYKKLEVSSRAELRKQR